MRRTWWKLLKNNITGDETWLYSYDTKQHRKHHNGNPFLTASEKNNEVFSITKVKLTVFFNWKGVVQSEYAPEGQTITQHLYLYVLIYLWDEVHHKRLQKMRICWEKNSSVHSVQLVEQFLIKYSTPNLRQPPYYGTIRLLYCFSITLKGNIFDDTETT
jgi:hypothetical protein